MDKVIIYTDGACSRKSRTTEDGEQFLCIKKIKRKYQEGKKIQQII